MELTFIALGVLLLLFRIRVLLGDTTARITRIERKLNMLLRHNGIDFLQDLPLSDRVKQLAGDPARKIEAIKIYREETGAGLKEAKDAIEAFINNL